MLASTGHRGFPIRTQRSFQTPRRNSLRVEELESRTLLSATDPANILALPAGHYASPSYNPNQFPSGYWPAQVRHAYGFDQLSYNGSGQTIAIVDAYDDPNVASDLAAFDAQYGIAAPPSFAKATPQGQPAADAGWASEIALDVEWAHAIAPAANILLVEAKSSSLGNLLGAVDYAVGHGAQVVSISWGAGEFSSETNYDWHFIHAGVTFVASSGDYGAPPSWPAISTHVLAVGGTRLNINSNDTWSSETGWGNSFWSPWYGGSGGGISRYEPKPSYQSSVTQSRFRRTNPDVSYVADPNTGLAVYDSYGSGGWAVFGGTSVGAPQWAALIALVNQGHGTPLTGDTQVLPAIYQIYKSSNYSVDFHDILSGNNGYQAGPGYDLVTGVGSPRANNLVPDLMNVKGTGPTVTKQPGSTPATSATILQLPRVVTLAAPAPALSFASVSITSAVTASSQPSLSVVAPMRGSGPLLPPPARPVETRIETGGENHAVLEKDEEPEQPARPPSGMPNQDDISSLALPVAADSAAEVQPTAALQQACDACFADTSWTADTDRPSVIWPRIATGSVDPAYGLAFVLGCYWSAQSKEPERRARRRLAV